MIEYQKLLKEVLIQGYFLVEMAHKVENKWPWSRKVQRIYLNIAAKKRFLCTLKLVYCVALDVFFVAMSGKKMVDEAMA